MLNTLHGEFWLLFGCWLFFEGSSELSVEAILEDIIVFRKNRPIAQYCSVNA